MNNSPDELLIIADHACKMREDALKRERKYLTCAQEAAVAAETALRWERDAYIRLLEEHGPDLLIDPAYTQVAERIYEHIRKVDMWTSGHLLVNAIRETPNSDDTAPVELWPDAQAMSFHLGVTVTDLRQESELIKAVEFVTKFYENYLIHHEQDASLSVHVNDMIYGKPVHRFTMVLGSEEGGWNAFPTSSAVQGVSATPDSFRKTVERVLGHAATFA